MISPVAKVCCSVLLSACFVGCANKQAGDDVALEMKNRHNYLVKDEKRIAELMEIERNMDRSMMTPGSSHDSRVDPNDLND